MKNLKHRAYLIFLFGLFCLAPAIASAATYQDVENFPDLPEDFFWLFLLMALVLQSNTYRGI